MPRRLFALLIGLICLALAQPAGATPFGSTSAPQGAFASASGYCADSEEAAFLKLINDYRAQNGLGALSLSQTLGAASDYHSTDMANKNYFNHTMADGTTYSQNFANFGYVGNGYTGENIAAGYQTASAAFTAWKNSAGHNANMLNANFKAIGIGRAFNSGSSYGWYWTTGFGGSLDTPGVICSGGTTPSPTPTTSPTTSVFVTALTGSSTIKRGAVSLTVSATIKDSKNASVSNASVNLKLLTPSGTSQTYTVTTNSRGQAIWTIKAGGTGTYTASVTGITSSGRTYDASRNTTTMIAINAS